MVYRVIARVGGWLPQEPSRYLLQAVIVAAALGTISACASFAAHPRAAATRPQPISSHSWTPSRAAVSESTRALAAMSAQ